MTNEIHTRRLNCDIRFEGYKHSFLLENVYRDILILLDFRELVCYESNLKSNFRDIVDNNVTKHYIIEFRIDLRISRFYDDSRYRKY